MNRLDQVFSQDRPALVTYLCAGDPNLNDSRALFQALLDAGTDVLEIDAIRTVVGDGDLAPVLPEQDDGG